MLRAIDGGTAGRGGRAFAHDPSARGYQLLYRPGEVNHCPACGRTQWYIGRLSAECAFCSTAVALADTGMTGVGVLHPRQRLRPLPAIDGFDQAA
ncbi:MAG TPA: hypothetical protein VGB70_10050 [Allosphingosinicella sp.]|jgi:hypothetical protein